MSGVKGALRQALSLPSRLRELEAGYDITTITLEHVADDIVKVEERMEQLESRIARLELALGMALVTRETEA